MTQLSAPAVQDAPDVPNTMTAGIERLSRETISLRAALRAATQVVHERLHHHSGFAAIQGSRIGRADYRRLLVRLYGFYAPFEREASVPPDRTGWLASDLAVLGLNHSIETIPTCDDLPCLQSVPLRLGAMYVVEGSALGGRELARGLDRLLGLGVTDGRRFFIGRDAGTGAAWQAHLGHLSSVPAHTIAYSEVIRGAVETFEAFERWLNDWSGFPHE